MARPVPSSTSLGGGCSVGLTRGSYGSGSAARFSVLAALLSVALVLSVVLSLSSPALASADEMQREFFETSTPDALLSPLPTSALSPTGTVAQVLTEPETSASPAVSPEPSPVPAVAEPSPTPSVLGPTDLPVGWDHPEVVEYRYAVFFGLCAIALLLSMRVVSGWRR